MTAGLLSLAFCLNSLAFPVHAQEIRNGWVVMDGERYWFDNGVRAESKEVYDPASDAWYWFDADGTMAHDKDVYLPAHDKWVRYDGEGHMIKGEDCRYGGWYFFDYVTGAMTKGFVYLPDADKWVHYDEVTGQMDHGEANTNGNWYCYDEITGAMVKGWYTFPDGRLTYYDTITGIMAHGMTGIDGDNYYFDDITGVYAYGIGAQHYTRREVRDYMNNSGASVDNQTEVESEAVLTAPYAAGTLTQQSEEDALAMLNEVRYIAGLGHHVTLDQEYVEMTQAAALLNTVNGELSHFPQQPSDMNDDLYALGSRGAGSSNIMWTSWRGHTLSSAILNGWVDDSDRANISRVGHRRWILNPSMGKTGFGCVSSRYGTYSAMYVFDGSSPSDIRGVAWPAMEMPNSYFDNSVAWSYSYGKYLSDVSVELVCTTDGKYQVWNFSDSASDGDFYVNNGGYGQTGCVIFRPSGVDIETGDSFMVTIRQADTVIARYPVNFFE